MKKILIALTIVLSCLGINKVSAASLEYTQTFGTSYFNVSDFNEFESFLDENEEIITELYKLLFAEYNLNYSSEYPYYIISIEYYSVIKMRLLALNSPVYFGLDGNSYGNTYLDSGIHLSSNSDNCVNIRVEYSFNEKTYSLPVVSHSDIILPHYGFQSNKLYETFFIDSNFDIKIITNYDSIIIHNFRDTNSDYIINSGDIYPTLYKNSNIYQDNYTEINLNDYAYVALALKDYNQKEFSTSVYVKGQHCLTPVYNFGMTERKDILTGTQVDRCSPYYDNYTPIRTYILDSDLKNNAIYYLKAYDTSKDNYVKIDTTVFDVTLITEDEKDNPYVTVNGKTYPTIPYDKLTDTATKSEDEDYISGASKDFDFSDIFTAPLEFLKDIWSSITSVFSLITELLSLLPPVMQNFLYASFMLAIAIGLIKILL